MTSKERVLAAINHIQPDRVPIDLRFVPEAMQKLKDNLGFSEKDVWDWIKQDVVTVRPTFPNPASENRYADPTIEISEEGYYLDIYRVPFKEVKTGFQTYLEVAGEPPLQNYQTLDELKSFPWPTTAPWDYSTIPSALEANKDKATWARSRGCFTTAQMMRGMDTFLTDLALNPDFACCILDHIMAFVMDDARRTLEAGEGKYTFCEYNDDVASQRSMMMSPDMWREFIKPRTASFCDLVHSYGVKVKYHSCGSIYAVIPDLIEIGVDILNPIQPLATDMDPFRLKSEFGDRLCFHGGIDIQELLPNASEQEVHRQVRKMIDIVGKEGGYIMAGSHTIQADADVDNLIAMVEEARGYSYSHAASPKRG